MDERTFCCPACRLLQPPALECVECVESGRYIGEIEASMDLLRYRLPSNVTRKKAEIKASIAGLGVATAASIFGLALLGPIGWAAIPSIAFGSMIGTGVLMGIRDRKYRSIVGVDVPETAIGHGAIDREGIARPLTGPITSRIDGAPNLVEHIVIRTPRSILLRRVFATPFVICTAPDELAILGEVRLATPITTQDLRASDPLFARLGIPAGMLPKKVVVDVRTIRPGDTVVARGVLEHATLQELAFHREGGQAQALNGRRGSLVVVRPPDLR